MPQIIINGNAIDPVAEGPELVSSGFMADNASQSNYILIQTAAPLTRDQKLQLQQMDAFMDEYVSENTYLLQYEPSDLNAIRRLNFVSWANVYNQDFKVQSTLKATSAPQLLDILSGSPNVPDQTVTHTVDITFHSDVSVDQSVVANIASIANVDSSQMSVGPKKIRVTVQHEALAQLATIDGIKAIQEVNPVQLCNRKAREILGADVILGNSSYQGEGEVVAVADTGFDLGEATPTKPYLAAFAGRVAKLYALGSRGLKDDPHGHGTHVAGSVLADGASDILGEGKIQGTAPKARLALQSVASVERGGGIGLGGLPEDLRKLFSQPYDDPDVKARVHTNSWGPLRTALPYTTTEAAEIDDFVWNHQDMVICFAAGNEGEDSRPANGIIDDGQIGAYAAAKNNITVGASENFRPEVATTWRQYGYNLEPFRNDKTANNPDGMAAFSNRGYTPEGRIKPDVVAPGTAILSAASRHIQARPSHPLADPNWRFMDGTSMATPLVAGCAAVVREVLRKEYKLDFIPAALVKALLINGADELKGQSPGEAGPSPNTSSGWGRVNLGKALLTLKQPCCGFKVGPAVGDDEEFTLDVTIPKPGKTLKITLVWTDPAGKLLQNDLDLIVIAGDMEFHGNAKAPMEKSARENQYDRVNNVEQIFWKDILEGDAQVIVRAYRITKYAQPFALAWTVY